MYKKCMIVIFAVIMLMGCGSADKANESASSDDSNIVSKDDIVDKIKVMFEQSGNTFSFEEVNKSILEGERVNITLNDKVNMQVFVYESPRNASEDAKRISSDGFTYTKTEGDSGIVSTIDWVDAPHFYKNNNIIILYLGSDEDILNKLTENFGEQIAGS